MQTHLQSKNIHLKALHGLSYLKYQYDKLSEYLRTNPGMKVLVVAAINVLTYEDTNDDEPYVTHEVKSRRYEVTNSTELQDVINAMAADIEPHIEFNQFHNSGVRVHSVDKTNGSLRSIQPNTGRFFYRTARLDKSKEGMY